MKKVATDFLKFLIMCIISIFIVSGYNKMRVQVLEPVQYEVEWDEPDGYM